MSVVLDASALVELLLRRPLWPHVEAVLRRCGRDTHVPALCDLEVASSLRRLLRTGAIDEQRTALAVDAYLDLPLRRHFHARLLRRVLELRSNLTSYDASYVALAEALGATLVTADGRLAAGARVASRIEVLDIRM